MVFEEAINLEFKVSIRLMQSYFSIRIFLWK